MCSPPVSPHRLDQSQERVSSVTDCHVSCSKTSLVRYEVVFLPLIDCGPPGLLRGSELVKATRDSEMPFSHTSCSLSMILLFQLEMYLQMSYWISTPSAVFVPDDCCNFRHLSRTGPSEWPSFPWRSDGRMIITIPDPKSSAMITEQLDFSNLLFKP